MDLTGPNSHPPITPDFLLLSFCSCETLMLADAVVLTLQPVEKVPRKGIIGAIIPLPKDQPPVPSSG